MIPNSLLVSPKVYSMEFPCWCKMSRKLTQSWTVSSTRRFKRSVDAWSFRLVTKRSLATVSWPCSWWQGTRTHNSLLISAPESLSSTSLWHHRVSWIRLLTSTWKVSAPPLMRRELVSSNCRENLKRSSVKRKMIYSMLSTTPKEKSLKMTSLFKHLKVWRKSQVRSLNKQPRLTRHSKKSKKCPTSTNHSLKWLPESSSHSRVWVISTTSTSTLCSSSWPPWMLC